MALNFSELLDKQRLRSLWQRALSEGTAATDSVAPVPGESRVPELGGPQIPIEPPHAVLAELEEYVRHQLGAGASVLGHLLHPLRAAVAKLDPRAAARSFHPLQQASTGSVPELLDKLEEALSGLVPPRPR